MDILTILFLMVFIVIPLTAIILFSLRADSSEMGDTLRRRKMVEPLTDEDCQREFGEDAYANREGTGCVSRDLE